MPSPTDVKRVQRLGSFGNYLAKFLQPLTWFLRSKNWWKRWIEIHEEAFKRTKKMGKEGSVLKYYDHCKPLVIQCDASEKVLGAALLQESQTLAYVSQDPLTDTETQHVQIEKELQAVLYAFERFHQYTFGQHITVLSDNRPLEAITKKELGKCPKRLQNILMQLQGYPIYQPLRSGRIWHKVNF